jgi:hypothetical protein
MTFIALDCLECKSICRVFEKETIRRLIASFELADATKSACFHTSSGGPFDWVRPDGAMMRADRLGA